MAHNLGHQSQLMGDAVENTAQIAQMMKMPEKRISALQNNLNFIYDNGSDHRGRTRTTGMKETPSKKLPNPTLSSFVQYLNDPQAPL